MKEMRNPPKALDFGELKNIVKKCSRLTSIDGGHNAFHNDWPETIQPSKGIDDLLQSRQFCNHVQKDRYQTTFILVSANEPADRFNKHLRQKAQIQGRNNPISLPSPLGQNESIGAFSPDNRAKKCKDHQWEGRGQRIDHKALNPRNG